MCSASKNVCQHVLDMGGLAVLQALLPDPNSLQSSSLPWTVIDSRSGSTSMAGIGGAAEDQGVPVVVLNLPPGSKVGGLLSKQVCR
jgi:hypothetical protein